MRTRDAELVLRVLDGLRRSVYPDVHPRPFQPIQADQVAEAILVVKHEIITNTRRSEAKRQN